MPLFDGFLTESVFADSVTNSNLILFVLIREYLSAIDLDNPVFSDVKQADEKVKFYMFCYSLLRNAPTDPFDCLRQDSSVLPTRIRVLLRDRFSQLRNFFELVNYTHPSTVRGLFFSDVPLEDEDKFMLTKDSVFGLFLRRFSLGFHHQSFEQMTEFLNGFFEAYDVSIHSNTQENSMPCTSTESVGPASGCVFSKPAKPIADSFAKLTCHQNDHSTHWKQNYGDSKPLSLHLSVPRYTSLLHATQKRNLTQAEHDLCAYFETEMSRERSDSGPNNICAYMAVAAADMHLSFGNW
ncbi:unnamed protein product [Dicrocoelium dendriticum]|nr:unnamed protein product [Dicrocoelium dendriticum]